MNHITDKFMKKYFLILMDLCVFITVFGIAAPALISSRYTLNVIFGFGLIGISIPLIYYITIKIIRSFREKN